MKKYAIIEQSFWKTYHEYWDENDARYGMETFTLYEIFGKHRFGVVLINKKSKLSKRVYFYTDQFYEVTPDENPEYFL